MITFAETGRTTVFLRMPVGWKQTAMGGCGAAIGGEANSGWFNPASLQMFKGWGGSSGYSMLALDRWFYYISAAGNLKDDAAVALTWVHADAGEIDGRDISGNHTQMLLYGEEAIFLTFSKIITREFTIGANAKYVQTRLHDAMSYMAGFDVGAHLRLLRGQLLVGAAYTNIAMEHQWDSKTLYGSGSGSTVDEPIAGYARVGAAYAPKQISGKITGEIGFYDGGDLEYRFGAAYEPIENGEIAVGLDDGLFTAGLGYRYDAGFAKFGLGYSFRMEREGLPARHTFDLTIGTK
jgi:hypothetical protein